MSGYGGTMATTFFPKKIITFLEGRGYQKSKKGKWYKKYDDGDEFIAMPSCKETPDGVKGATWYMFTTEEPKRQLHLEEARQLSEKFDEDFVEIRETMTELE